MENNMTPEQVVEKINNLIAEKMDSTVNVEQFNDLKSQLEGFKSLEAKSTEIEKAIAKMEGKMEGLAELGKKHSDKPVGSVGEQVVDGYKSAVVDIKSGKPVEFEVKATTITEDYSGTIALSTLEAGVNTIARPALQVSNVINRGTTTSKYVVYIKQVRQASAAWTAEGVAKTITDIAYEEVSVEVKKIAALIKISKEMLDDLAFVRGEVNSELMKAVEQGIENAVINGAVGGFDGIMTNAVAFAAGSFAAAVPNAQLDDVIRIAVAQIQSADFNPTHVVLNPFDVAALHLNKTTTGEYTYPIFMVDPLTGLPKIANLTIISSTLMPLGDFLVGDMSKSNLRLRETVGITVGYESDDFRKNLVSIIGEARAAHYVKENDYDAFVKGDIATCIAAINA